MKEGRKEKEEKNGRRNEGWMKESKRKEGRKRIEIYEKT